LILLSSFLLSDGLTSLKRTRADITKPQAAGINEVHRKVARLHNVAAIGHGIHSGVIG
jgi:hypothetical protein